tara:strand:+ start:1635 stop:3065 length:1431 start_codon:yes stop_codon:yes gene_type:complete
MDKEIIIKFIQEALRCSSETPVVEFKDGRGGLPKDTWRTVSSFSHKPGGGIIAFGFDDNKKNKKIKIIGLKNIALLQEKLSDLTSHEMSFPLRPDYHIIDRLKNKDILAVYIPECPNQFKPCYYKSLGIPNGACIRDGNTDRRMTEDEARELIANSKKFKFDITQAQDVKLEELSKGKILKLLIKSGKRTKRNSSLKDINFELLKNLSIADEFNGKKIPTLAGFLIFAKNKPQKKSDFSRYIIRCVRYKGSSVSSDIIDKADIDGTLDEQIDEMQKFILRNIKKSAKIIGTKRVEKYEYPKEAIREIVANAVIHRDYKITETYTQVNIFEDRVEVFNPGCLPPGVTIENIKDAQVSRNEIIAERLKELDYLEEYGRGIAIVFNKMTEWNLLPPVFKNTSNSFKVILMGERLSALNNRQVKIWEYLTDSRQITIKECEKILSESPRTTLSNDLKKMKNMGLIRQIGKSVKTYYEANF